MNKAKRTMAGVLMGAAVLGGAGAVSTLAAGTASASSCTYHSRVMFGNAIIDGYGGGPQVSLQNAWAKARAHGISTANAKVMWTQYECN